MACARHSRTISTRNYLRSSRARRPRHRHSAETPPEQVCAMKRELASSPSPAWWRRPRPLRLCAFRRRRFPRGQVFAHFFEALWTNALDGPQIIHALERAIRLAHLQNLLRDHGPDPRHLLQLVRRRGIQVDRRRRRLLFGNQALSHYARQRKKQEN